MSLDVGDTLTLELKPDALVTVRCGDVALTEGRMGRVGDKVAVRVVKPLRKPKTTFAMFEMADQSSKPDGSPMSNGLGLMIESLVAVLLLLTIRFCIVLNRRLKKLKADEQALKGTISELITATEIAERAIAGLKMTVRDCDQNLSERLRAGESLARELGGQLDGGRQVLAATCADHACGTRAACVRARTSAHP